MSALPAATRPVDDPLQARLLVVGSPVEHPVTALPDLLSPGDLLVVNDAATLPASLPLGRGEVRLAGPADPAFGAWVAVLFGPGDWRTRTEDRPPPPSVTVGTVLRPGGLEAIVEAVSPLSTRLLTLRFTGEADRFWAGLYRSGRPVQYSHLRGDLQLWHVGTPYAGPPSAVEMPSAGRPLVARLRAALAGRGVGLARLTHAAGLSATGDAALDAALPLPELYEVPAETLTRVEQTRSRGGRVVAVGTSVVRALESATGPGRRFTDLRLGAGSPLCRVDGLLTGLHEPGTSHHALLQAFVDAGALDEAGRLATARGLRGHEFGDLALAWRRGLR